MEAYLSEKYKRRPHIESPHGAAAYLVKGGRRPPVNMWSPLVFAAFNHKSSTTPNLRMNSNVSKGVQVFQVSGMGRDIWGKITALRELLSHTNISRIKVPTINHKGPTINIMVSKLPQRRVR